MLPPRWNMAQVRQGLVLNFGPFGIIQWYLIKQQNVIVISIQKKNLELIYLYSYNYKHISPLEHLCWKLPSDPKARSWSSSTRWLISASCWLQVQRQKKSFTRARSRSHVAQWLSGAAYFKRTPSTWYVSWIIQVLTPWSKAGHCPSVCPLCPTPPAKEENVHQPTFHSLSRTLTLGNHWKCRCP